MNIKSELPISVFLKGCRAKQAYYEDLNSAMIADNLINNIKTLMEIIKNPYKNDKGSSIEPEKIEEVDQDQDKDSLRKLVKNPETGLWFLKGPKITKEMVERDFPTDCCRDAIILRRSVGLE